MTKRKDEVGLLIKRERTHLKLKAVNAFLDKIGDRELTEGETERLSSLISGVYPKLPWKQRFWLRWSLPRSKQEVCRKINQDKDAHPMRVNHSLVDKLILRIQGIPIEEGYIGR